MAGVLRSAHREPRHLPGLRDRGLDHPQLRAGGRASAAADRRPTATHLNRALPPARSDETCADWSRRSCPTPEDRRRGRSAPRADRRPRRGRAAATLRVTRRLSASSSTTSIPCLGSATCRCASCRFRRSARGLQGLFTILQYADDIDRDIVAVEIPHRRAPARATVERPGVPPDLRRDQPQRTRPRRISGPHRRDPRSYPLPERHDVISEDRFRKSSFSGAGGCVEVRLLPDGRIALRDSKDVQPCRRTTSRPSNGSRSSRACGRANSTFRDVALFRVHVLGSPRSCAAIAARSISDDTAAMRPSRKR